jgi:selenocysteine lyase/cysteine desulfurase
MNEFNSEENNKLKVSQPMEDTDSSIMDNTMSKAMSELKQSVYIALETYSNVHRGSGYNSAVTTKLFEDARDIVMDYIGLNKNKFVIIFCTPRREKLLMSQIASKYYHSLSSQNIGLAIGVRALAVYRKALPKGIPFQTGGGTAGLVSRDWVVWDNAPEKFEAGTPAIINIITFAKALQLVKQIGNNIFKDAISEKLTANEILYQDELKNYSGRELLDKFRQKLIGCNTLVPTMEGTRPFINLDNGASTPTFMPVWNVFYEAWRQSKHVQQEIIQNARSVCATLLDAPLNSYDIIFTSNTTEAINLVAESMQLQSDKEIEPVVLNTILEHNSNELPWRLVPGLSMIRMAVDAEGFVDLNELEKLLCSYNKDGKEGKKRIKLVALSGASNVLGVFNDLEEISKIVHRYGANLMVDAAQLVAHRKVEMEKFGIDYLAFSAHKVYAPFGTGVLIVRKGLLNFNSSELQLIQSSGEENVAGIAALGKSLEILQRIGMDVIFEEEQVLTARVLKGMAQIPGLRLYGIKDPASPRFNRKGGVFVFSMKGMMSNEVAKKLALKGGIGVRYGCHCAHMIIKRLLNVSPFLERFQRIIVTLFPKVRLPGLVRVSLGIENSEAEVDVLIQVLGKIAQKPPIGNGRNIDSRQNDTNIVSQKEVQIQINDSIKASTFRVYN